MYNIIECTLTLGLNKYISINGIVRDVARYDIIALYNLVYATCKSNAVGLWTSDSTSLTCEL